MGLDLEVPGDRLLAQRPGRLARVDLEHAGGGDPESFDLELYRLAGSEYEHVATFESPAVALPEDFPGLRIPLDDVFRREHSPVGA